MRCSALSLEIDDLQSPFQPKPFYGLCVHLLCFSPSFPSYIQICSRFCPTANTTGRRLPNQFSSLGGNGNPLLPRPCNQWEAVTSRLLLTGSRAVLVQSSVGVRWVLCTWTAGSLSWPLLSEQDAQVAARERVELKSGVTSQIVPASSNEEGKCPISGENLSSYKGGWSLSRWRMEHWRAEERNQALCAVAGVCRAAGA